MYHNHTDKHTTIHTSAQAYRSTSAVLSAYFPSLSNKYPNINQLVLVAT